MILQDMEEASQTLTTLTMTTSEENMAARSQCVDALAVPPKAPIPSETLKEEKQEKMKVNEKETEQLSPEEITIDLKDFQEVRRSPRIAKETELSKQRAAEEKRRKELEAIAAAKEAVSNKALRCGTPRKHQGKAKWEQGTPKKSSFASKYSMKSAPLPARRPSSNFTPRTPNSTFESAKVMQESPFNDYLEQKYKEIFLRQAASSAGLPSLQSYSEASTSSSIESLYPQDSKKMNEKEFMNECAPIDLARTNSLEIYKSLLALDPDFKSTIAGEEPADVVLPLGRKLARISPNPTETALAKNSEETEASMDKEALPLPMLRWLDSGFISLSDGIAGTKGLSLHTGGGSGGSLPTTSLQPQTSLDLFRLFHQDYTPTVDHVMDLESMTNDGGMTLWKENEEDTLLLPTATKGIRRDHRNRSIVSIDTTESTVPSSTKDEVIDHVDDDRIGHPEASPFEDSYETIFKTPRAVLSPTKPAKMSLTTKTPRKKPAKVPQKMKKQVLESPKEAIRKMGTPKKKSSSPSTSTSSASAPPKGGKRSNSIQGKNLEDGKFCELKTRVWNQRFKELEAFYHKHKHFHVRRTTGGGDKYKSLYHWIKRQVRYYDGGRETFPDILEYLSTHIHFFDPLAVTTTSRP